ncbi:Crp/Fnr family transcriptional regulator [Alkalinema pantanalense CENA528]|uniref:Crp/Fnr family transcriptional regulator n=1 Tax=Alkalinema pantanalense TaxID=1620705 RepID=UPI003D6F3B8A
MSVATLVLPSLIQQQHFNDSRLDSASAIVPTYPKLSLGSCPKLTTDYDTFQRGNLLPEHPQVYWKIRQGVVRTNTWDIEGALKTVGIWGAGDIVGAGLSTLSPYQMECLSPVKIEPLTHLNDFAETLIHQQQQTEALLNIILVRHTQQRLLKLLDWLADRFGRDWGEGARMIDIRLTHQHLADLAGTTRVTVTRLLNQLEHTHHIQRLPQYRFVIYPSAR